MKSALWTLLLLKCIILLKNVYVSNESFFIFPFSRLQPEGGRLPAQEGILLLLLLLLLSEAR